MAKTPEAEAAYQAIRQKIIGVAATDAQKLTRTIGREIFEELDKLYALTPDAGEE